MTGRDCWNVEEHQDQKNWIELWNLQVRCSPFMYIHWQMSTNITTHDSRASHDTWLESLTRHMTWGASHDIRLEEPHQRNPDQVNSHIDQIQNTQRKTGITLQYIPVNDTGITQINIIVYDTCIKCQYITVNDRHITKVNIMIYDTCIAL